jgi:type IV pilus assembly protein PilM
MEVLLVVAQEDMINAHVDTLHAAGLAPTSIDVEPLAAARALVNIAGEQLAPQSVCVINVGAAATEITIVRQLILSFVRPIPIAGDSVTRAIGQSFIVENDEAERLKRTLADVGAGNGGAAPEPAAPAAAPGWGAPLPTEVPDLTGDRTTHLEIDQAQPLAGAGPPVPPKAEIVAMPAVPAQDQTRRQIRDVIMPVFAELITEVRRSLDFYRRQHRNEAIDRIYLIGGTASLPNVARLIQSETGIATEIGNPYLHIHCDPAIATPEYLRDIAPVTTIAVGLAMRNWVE